MSTVARNPRFAQPRPAVTAPADVPTMPIYRLSVAQYRAMIEHGILTEADRVEFIRGWLVAKMTKNPPHTVACTLLRDALLAVVPAGWHFRGQETIALPDSDPEPDGAVVHGQTRDYSTRHPTPDEVALLVEVADSTLNFDRKVKKPLYAELKVPIYWIVNLIDQQVEVYTDPSGPAVDPDYANRQVLQPGDEIAVVIAGQEIARIPVAVLLP